MDSQFDMEANGNGTLDHLTSSPTSQPATQPITGYFHRYQRLHAQRLEYDRLFEVSACLLSNILILVYLGIVCCSSSSLTNLLIEILTLSSLRI